MRNIQTILLCFGLVVSSAWADLDCPADSAVHLDTRTMLPDGSPNPSYGQEISTGLCGCIGFVDGASIDGNEVTFTLRLLDNEPIRGIELDIYHDSSVLTYSGVSKGEKLDNVTNCFSNNTYIPNNTHGWFTPMNKVVLKYILHNFNLY